MVGSRPENGDSAPVDTREQDRLDRILAEDPVVAAAQPIDAVQDHVHETDLSLGEVVRRLMTGYADRPAVGERRAELVTDPATGRTTSRLLPEFETTTYGELWDRVGAVAAEWHHDAQRPVSPGDFVCLLGFTSTDYTTVDLATIHTGTVCVPMQSSASLGQLKPIVAETGPRIIATSIETVDNAVELAVSGPTDPRVLVFDYQPEVDDQRAKFEAARQRLTEAGSPGALDSLRAVVARGAELPAAPQFEPAAGEDPLALLVYTSGSTGAPKGAMYPQSLLRAAWAGFAPVGSTIPAITVSYMPMSHIAGRNSLTSTFVRGGTTYFAARSDLSTLFEDIGLARPTDVLLVPRVCDMLFQHHQSELERRRGEFADEAELDAAVKQDVRENFLGGRIVRAIVGSAPISPEMKQFVEDCLQLPLHDAYGSTEAGGVFVDGHVQRPPVIDYKLVDVPELGYFSTDSPHPRGELLLKTRTIVPGYFQRPDVTAEMFDEDGYYRTGDVVAELGPDRLAYIDRRKNVLKLSQGEFVAVSNLEAEFATSPLVRQIFVYGNSSRPYLLAVVVPTEDAQAKHPSPEDLKAAISESLQQVAKEAELNSYEIPRDFLVETEPFTNENGILSDARKLLRPRAVEKYGERLEQLYAELAEGQASELRELRRHGHERPVLETVSRAAQALLGCSSTDLDPGAHFTDLGGDSLSALTFSNLLQEIFDVQVPVGVVISPATDLRGIAGHIAGERESGAQRPTVAAVHGKGATAVRADDLALEKFLPAETLQTAAELPAPAGDEPRTVLLTGANGYLGRFLCLEWLERLAERGGTLYCLVRGNDAAAARQRLDKAFDSGDADLRRHYEELADEHLRVLAGDVGEPDLGLDAATWNQLASDVDQIVHPAALVNHVLPYEQLFGPNVVGTAELVRMALTTRLKPVTYLSTVGVGSDMDPAQLDENADIRATSPSRPLHEGYANGYSASKWAGEVLLRNAHERFGLPVTTFRSDMILAHGRYAGQLNVPDMFTRLVLSVVATGIAPRTFYRSDDGERPRAHYDGLPADFTAEAITTLGSQNTSGYQTYNVLNPHADGLSLDVFVDWLNEAGHPVQRVDDYGDWVARFETAMRALPEDQRQHTLLPLLHAFQEPAPPVDGSVIPADVFRAAVQEAKIGADQDIPHLSKELIAKYVTDLKQLGLL